MIIDAIFSLALKDMHLENLVKNEILRKVSMFMVV